VTKVSEYGFDEGVGLHAYDSSGNGRSLVASNASSSWDSGGHSGSGAKTKFTGVIGANSAINTWTVMAWVKRTGTWTGFAGICASSSQGFFFEADAGSSYNPNCYGGSTSAVAASALTLNTWVHVAAVCTAGSIQMFINGSSSGSAATGNSARNFGTGTFTVAGGAGDEGEDSAFGGIVDELKVFDTAFTGSEITTEMGTPPATGGVTQVATTTGAPANASAFSITLPSGYASGDRMICVVTGKYETTTIPTINQSWTLIGSGTGGTGSAGNDTGQTFWAAYAKDATSGSETAPTVTPGGTAPNSWEWVCSIFRKPSSESWLDAIGASAAWCTSASDTSTSSPLTGTAGAFTGVQPTDGDGIFVVGTAPTDLGSALGATTLTATGLSAGKISSATSQYVENALGNDTCAVWASWLGFAGTASAGVAASLTITSATNQSGSIVALALRSGSSGQTVGVGLVTETDSTFSVTRLKARTVGQPTETDKAFRVAQPVGRTSETDATFAPSRQKLKAVGLVTETGRVFRVATPVGRTSEADTSQAVAKVKSKAVGLNVETGTVFAVARKKVKTSGLPTEANTALQVSRLKVKAIGLTTETNTALPVSRSKIRSVGLVAETDAPFAVARKKAKSLGLATEADSTFAATAQGSHTIAVGLITETDTVFGVTRLKSKAVGLTTQTNTAQPVSRIKIRTVGLTTSTELAQPITRRKAKTVGILVETDTPLAPTRRKIKTAGLTSQTETVFAVTRRKTRTTGLPAETDTTFLVGVGGAHILGVGLVVETDLCQPTIKRKVKTVGFVTETGTVFAVAHTRSRIPSIVSETDLCQSTTRKKIKTLGFITQTDTVLPAQRVKTRSKAQLLETDTVFTLVRKKIKPVGLTVEVDVVLHAIISGLNIPYVVNGTLDVKPSWRALDVKPSWAGLDLHRNLATLDVED
jgi:hypothetical protein